MRPIRCAGRGQSESLGYRLPRVLCLLREDGWGTAGWHLQSHCLSPPPSIQTRPRRPRRGSPGVLDRQLGPSRTVGRELRATYNPKPQSSHLWCGLLEHLPSQGRARSRTWQWGQISKDPKATGHLLCSGRGSGGSPPPAPLHCRHRSPPAWPGIRGSVADGPPSAYPAPSPSGRA